MKAPEARPAPGMVDVGRVARLFEISERAVQKLAKEGVIPRAQRGQYDLLASVQGYIRHLRRVAAGRSSESGGADLVGERARLAAEQADSQAMKNAQLRGELLPSSDIETAIATLHSTVARSLLGLPTAVADLVALEQEPRACEQIIRRELEHALQAIADARLEILPPAAAASARPARTPE